MLESEIQDIMNKISDLQVDVKGRVATPLLDIFFPNGGRSWYRETFSVYEDNMPTYNIPCVEEGIASFPLKKGSGSVNEYYPLEIRPSINLKAREIRLLKKLRDEDTNTYLSNKQMLLVNTILKSVEAMLATLFTGTDGTMSYYKALGTETVAAGETLDFGTVATYAHGTDYTGWDQAGATVEDVAGVLESAKDELDPMFRGPGIFLCSKDMWNYAAGIIHAHDGTIKFDASVNYEDHIIYIAGFKLVYLTGSYYAYDAAGAMTATEYIPDNHIFFIPDNLPKDLLFFEVPEIEADFPAVPFYLKSKYTDDPSGIKMIGSSRPLPYVYAPGIVYIDAYDGS